MSWASKSWKKAKHWVGHHAGDILNVMTGGFTVPFTMMYDAYQDGKDLEKEILAEQQRANEEAAAIARAQGATATTDNAGELTSADELRRKRGYLGTLKGQKDGTNTLLAAAASYGNKKTLGA